ncbi:MAG: hypothetical protein ACTS3F_02380 [Phycisphaerales bacterium]
MSNKNQPVEQVRIGTTVAAIWANETDKGVRYGVTFERLYRTEDGKWKSTPTFNRDDLLVLAKVADRAHTRVYELMAASRSNDRDDGHDPEPAESQPKPPVPSTGGASAAPPPSKAARARRELEHAR